MAKNKKPTSAVLQGKRYETEDPDRYLAKRPVWSFKRMDAEHQRWSIKSCSSLYDTIIVKLKDLEGMTWQEIMEASGGRSSGTNSHFEDTADLCKEARDRLLELHMEDEDRVFSLRLTGKERLYGILEQGTFFIIWYDRTHEIYPVSK